MERVQRLESAARNAKLRAVVCPLVFGGVGLYLTVDSYRESKQKEAELERLRAQPQNSPNRDTGQFL